MFQVSMVVRRVKKSIPESIDEIKKVFIVITEGNTRLVSYENIYRLVYNYYIDYCTGLRSLADYMNVKYLCDMLDELEISDFNMLRAIHDCLLYPIHQETKSNVFIPCSMKLVIKKIIAIHNTIKQKQITMLLHHSTTPVNLPLHLWDLIGKYITF